MATAIERVLATHGLEASFAMLAPETDEGTPFYRLFLTTAAPLPDGLADEIEARLAENPHYALCVRLGQLAPARVVRVGTDAPVRVLRRLADDGQRLGNVKPSALSARTGWMEWLVEQRDPCAHPHEEASWTMARG